jgi:predicted alpha/beta-fold hydrolase
MQAHFSTLWAALVPGPRISFTVESLPLPDGDVATWGHLAPTTLSPQGKPSPRGKLLILPGLEGSFRSTAVRWLAWSARRAGWAVSVLVARGAAGHLNRHPRSTHAGEWQDAATAVQHLQQQHAGPVVAVGLSLGGNQLLNGLCAGWPGFQPPTLAAAICPPFDLGGCADHLERGFPRLYGQDLLRCLRRAAWARRQVSPVSAAELARWRTLRAFDHGYTAPRNGFASAAAYYAATSCGPQLAALAARGGSLAAPTWILSSQDDPLVPVAGWPKTWPAQAFFAPQARGGHLGFLDERTLRPGWTERLLTWLDTMAPFVGATRR